MSLEANTQYFDVIGPGYVAEHHADEQHRHLLETDNNAVGGAMIWLAFYAVAIVAAMTASFQKAINIVVAAAN